MMVPIRIGRFEVGERVAKKKAMAKNKGFRLRQDRIATTAAAAQPSRAAMAFQSSQLPNPQPNKGISL